MNKKLCECCQKTIKTKTYSFTNDETCWSRQWCRKCYKKWNAKLIASKASIPFLLEISPCSFLEKVIKKIKEWML